MWRKVQPLYMADRNAKWYSCFEKIVWQVPQKVKNEIPLQPAILLFVCTQDRWKHMSMQKCTYKCPQKHYSKCRNISNYSATDEWVNQMWLSPIKMEYKKEWCTNKWYNIDELWTIKYKKPAIKDKYYMNLLI